MDIYPNEYIQHPLPVLFIKGIEEDLKSPKIPKNNPLAESLPEVLKARTCRKIKDLLGVDFPPSAWESGNVAQRFSHNQPFTINLNPPSFSSTELLAGTDRLFKVALVNNAYTIPQKRPKSFQGMVSTHSPLSPFSPASPLHPDGLIASIWLNNHFNENPSALLSFHELWYPDNGNDNKDITQFNNSAAILSTIKEKDAALAAELNELRKNAHEQSIKFSVVVWNLRSNEDGLFEDRIVHIRRACGLDQRTELFVLSREDTESINVFLSNVQKAIYEPSLHYYREKYRSAKKKLSRVPSMALRAGELSPSSPSIRPLSSLGWTTRFEFKLAIFSLIRQDFNNSIKHFEAAYGTLSEMMTSSEIDVTNKVRWNEAKLLIECMNFHICRLYLYLDMGQASLTQLNRHVWGFKSLWKSLNNKAPEFKFERNTWFARQYKSFAELLDCGIRFGKNYIQTAPKSNLQSTSIFLIGGNPTWKGITTPSSPNRSRFKLQNPRLSELPNNQGTHPLTILQHPGYYFYESAQYQSKRYSQYLLLKSEESLAGGILDKESEVDHTQLIIESLSKSYEQFKKYKGGRMTLWVASEIADSYLLAEKYDLALKFYERIAKTFRKDYWPQILESTLKNSIKCVKNLPDNEESFIRYSIELLSPNFTAPQEERANGIEALLQMINKPIENSKDVNEQKVVVIEMDELSSFLKVNFAFKENNGILNQPSPFQINLSLLKFPADFILKLSSIKINFDNPDLDVTFENDDSSPTNQFYKLKEQEYEFFNCNSENQANYISNVSTNLEIKSSIIKYLQGHITPTKLNEIKVIAITVHITTESWDIVLKFPIKSETRVISPDVEEPLPNYPSHSFKWLYSHDECDSMTLKNLKPGDANNALKVQAPISKIKITAKHLYPAYLEEIYPIKLEINSPDEAATNVLLNFEWNKSSLFNDKISLDPDFNENTHTNIKIEDINLNGVKEITTYVHFSSILGTRNLHALLTYNVQTPNGEEKREKKELIQIEVISPFKIDFKCLTKAGGKTKTNHESSDAFPCGLSFIAPVLTFSKEYLLLTTLTSFSPNPVNIKSIAFIDSDSTRDGGTSKSKFLSSSFSSPKSLLTINPKIPYSFEQIFEFTLLCEPSLSTNKPSPWTVKPGHVSIEWHRANTDTAQTSTFKATIPTLQIPSYRLYVELDTPNETFEGIPFTINYTILNVTSCTEEIVCSLDMSDIPLVYSGYKVANLRVLPHSYIKLPITCHALTYGKIKVPPLKVERKRTSLITPTQVALASTPTILTSESYHSANSTSGLGTADIQFDWNLEETYLLVKPQHIKRE
ncbi:hypothetical protein K502DRAFT_347560 [Neoconidiobolus thromboides FSU 785]|nr:hypothetical protein K502DRAFT_347560 [Neoconidiobolus thromboides FSU 785]